MSLSAFGPMWPRANDAAPGLCWLWVQWSVSRDITRQIVLSRVDARVGYHSVMGQGVAERKGAFRLFIYLLYF